MSFVGMLVLGAACVMGTACAFDPAGASPSGGDDVGDAIDAATSEPIDAGHTGTVDAHASAADAAVSELGVLHCKHASTPPTLDGHLGEWATQPASGFDMGSAAQVLDQTAGYVPSVSTDFRCMHDDGYIYFAVHVLDDHLSTDSQQLYNDDAANLYLDARGDALGLFGQDDHEIVVRADGMYADYATGAAAIQLVGEVLADPATNDFTIEIAIAKSSLGAIGALPARLGFDLAVTDDDGLGAFAYGLWYLSDRLSCPSCCNGFAGARAWCDTTTFGSLVLD